MAFLTMAHGPAGISDAELNDAWRYVAERITCVTPRDTPPGSDRFSSAINRFTALMKVDHAPYIKPPVFEPPENFIASLSVHNAPRKSSTQVWAEQLLKQLRGGTKLVDTPLGSLPASPPPSPPPGSPSEPADSTAGVLAALTRTRTLPPLTLAPSPPTR